MPDAASEFDTLAAASELGARTYTPLAVGLLDNLINALVVSGLTIMLIQPGEQLR